MKPFAGVDLEEWRRKATEVCLRRGWSLAKNDRFYFHALEAAELSEALRGKSGDPVEEAGDLLFTALLMIPPSIGLQHVVERNEKKMEDLMTRPHYPGEERQK